MATNYTPSNLRLPQEVIDMILRHIDDPTFLWVICRKVSRECRLEVEAIFRELWLRKTCIMWLWDDPIHDFFYEAQYSRVSSDGNTAYFRVQPYKLFIDLGPLLQNQFTAFRWAAARLDIHQALSRRPSFFDRVRVVTQIGQDINKTLFSDLPLPEFTRHEATAEISINWKAHFTLIFNEEYLLSRLKAQAGITTPSTPQIDLAYPIIIPFDLDEMPSSNDFDQRIQVRQRRAQRLGWYKPPAVQDATYKEYVEGALQRFTTFQNLLRLSDVFIAHDLWLVECRGNEYAVQEPRQNGWNWPSRRMTRLYGSLLYNHMWEDPKHGGRTTWSEDPLVIEVEGMARAWEKGLD
jgi:hypothetical protein